MKRLAAWLLDIILLCVIATGIAWALSAMLGYDSYNDTVSEAYARYEAQYSVTFSMTAEEFAAMSEQEVANYNAAYNALVSDEGAMYAYQMVINLTLLIITVGILLAAAILEFIVPLLLKNGQTIGKKLFSLGVIRHDGVQLNTMQLFVRSMLGKFTIETMVPVYLVLMIFWSDIGLVGTLVLLALLLLQIILICATGNNCPIHDLLAGTVVVDISSQKIFRSTQDLIEYTKRIHAEQAARRPY